MRNESSLWSPSAKISQLNSLSCVFSESKPDHDESKYNSLSNLFIEKKIGKGQFSEVYRAKCLMDNETVALKKIQVSSCISCLSEITVLNGADYN